MTFLTNRSDAVLQIACSNVVLRTVASYQIHIQVWDLNSFMSLSITVNLARPTKNVNLFPITVSNRNETGKFVQHLLFGIQMDTPTCWWQTFFVPVSTQHQTQSATEFSEQSFRHKWTLTVTKNDIFLFISLKVQTKSYGVRTVVRIRFVFEIHAKISLVPLATSLGRKLLLLRRFSESY